jgi:hypothetical protein
MSMVISTLSRVTRMAGMPLRPPLLRYSLEDAPVGRAGAAACRTLFVRVERVGNAVAIARCAVSRAGFTEVLNVRTTLIGVFFGLVDAITVNASPGHVVPPLGSGLMGLAHFAKRADYEELFVADPLAGVGVEHLGCEVDDAIHGALGERALGPLSHEATDEVAMVAVK